MARKIYLTEEQVKNFIQYCLMEGVKWGNLDGNLSLSVNNDKTDAGNLTGNYVDTRVFGNRNEILYGDNTNKQITSLSDTVLGRRAIMTTMLNLISYIENGRNGIIFTDKNLPGVTKSSIDKWLANLSDEEILKKAKQTYSYWQDASKQKEGIYNRANVTGNKKIMRYSLFTIPGTDVNCIALFNMKDFSISDAIKKGTFSPRSEIIDNPDNYKLNNKGTIDVVYDNGVRSDVASNFSIDANNDGNTDHYKQQYQLQNAPYNNGVYDDDSMAKELSKKQNYTTVNQFLDKSIMYASRVLHDVSFMPDYMITVPSSSKMNYYYAINLGRKTGCEFLPDFFKRNIINAHLRNGVTDEDLLNDGMTEEMVATLKNEIKDYAYQEITYNIEVPLRKMVEEHADLFANISTEKHSREKFSINRVITLLSKYCFRTIMPTINKEDVIAKHLCDSFLNNKSDYYDTNFLNSMLYIVNLHIGRKVFGNVLLEMKKLFEYYSNEIQKGYYPGKKQYGLGQSKITRIPKMYRQYIDGSFIIADKYAKENSRFFDGLQNKKLLIIDEDINTGTSFQLAISAIKERMPSKKNETLMCLANGYSEAGNNYFE